MPWSLRPLSSHRGTPHHLLILAQESVQVLASVKLSASLINPQISEPKISVEWLFWGKDCTTDASKIIYGAHCKAPLEDRPELESE